MNNWAENELTQMLQLEVPILQAPMAEYTTPELAAAVSNAGGLGALGMWGFSAEEVEQRISGFRKLSQGSLQVNYPLWGGSPDLSDVAIPMRKAIQKLYDAKDLGIAPEPTSQATASTATNARLRWVDTVAGKLATCCTRATPIADPARDPSL